MEPLKKSPDSPLCVHLMELVSLRIAQLNDCKLAMAIHHEALKCLGDTEVRLSLLSIWKEVLYFSTKEKALLALTDSLVDQKADKPSDAVYDLLLPHFGREKICNLIVAIKQIDYWALVMKQSLSQ